MDVNDDASHLDERVVLALIASKLRSYKKHFVTATVGKTRCLPGESFGLDRSLAALGSGYRECVLRQAGR